MKLVWFKRQIQACYLRGGFLMVAACFLLASVSVGQAADTQIAFVSDRDFAWNTDIYLMNSNGKQIRRLTGTPKNDTEPAWSPDGQKITFVSYRDLKKKPEPGVEIWLGEIYLMNADGTNPINLTQAPEKPDGVSSWSPDGKQIAFTSAELFNAWTLANSDIWVMEADGGNPRNLTNHDALDQTPDWSPDGRWIAFSSNRDGDWEIHVMNADGTNSINLTNHLARDGRPDWSPDGNQIAFSSDRDGNSEIYVMNADGTNPINLTNHLAVDDAPDWSPDGKQIAFDSYRDKDWEIYVMNADGTNPINLTQNPDAFDYYPAWGPVPTLSVASKGKLAALWGKVKRTNTHGVK